MTPGMQIGAYRLLERLGQGGMGVVWVAEHAMLGRRAALKVLRPAYSIQPTIVQRFFNEARAASAISDPGIVQIFDFGQHTDGSAYIVMELLEGEGLEVALEREGALGLGDATRIIRQIASSLAVAHARGIVHRDLKPENIFLVRDAEVLGGTRAKILDFGIAKLVGDSAGGGVQTSESSVLGTPVYMSPEQCRGAGLVDLRSDVYALGCLLMTLATGRPPFEAEGIGEIIAMHLREPAPSAAARNAAIPPALDALIARCLAKDPNARFANCTELANALGALVLPASASTMPAAIGRAIVARPMPAAATTLSQMASQATTGATPRRRSIMPFAIAGGLLLGGAGAAIAVVTTGGNATPVVDPSRDATTSAITATLAAFLPWSATHANVACPANADLGDRRDAWGHALVVTCTDQPGDHIIGVTSLGPDGSAGTTDDIASWTLDRTATAVVRGPRWAATVANAATAGNDATKSPAGAAGAAGASNAGAAAVTTANTGATATTTNTGASAANAVNAATTTNTGASAANANAANAATTTNTGASAAGAANAANAANAATTTNTAASAADAANAATTTNTADAAAKITTSTTTAKAAAGAAGTTTSTTSTTSKTSATAKTTTSKTATSKTTTSKTTTSKTSTIKKAAGAAGKKTTFVDVDGDGIPDAR